MSIHCNRLLAAAILALPFTALAQLKTADSLYGIHWYGPTGPDRTEMAGQTAAEEIAAGMPLWVLEIAHLDTITPDPNPGVTGIQASPWDRPEWFVSAEDGGHLARVTGHGKGHTVVMRIQPNWGRNVPYFEAPGSPNNDPFTVADFASAAEHAARTMKDYVRFWQVGNEVNLDSIENHRWNPETKKYDIVWKPSPEEYAATYVAVRDAIHKVTPNFDDPTQVVLMQASSPGIAGNPAERYIDSSEFLWRMINAIPADQRDKIDGFVLHSYAEPGGANDGLDGFMEAITEQLMVIDSFGLSDRPALICEFNKHMPDAENAAVAARFVQRAFTALNDWNHGTGGEWPGQPNHNIVSAMWFTFPEDNALWKDYSLVSQKALIGGTDPNVNPFYGYQAAAKMQYKRGSLVGDGAKPDPAAKWWEDDFRSLDIARPLPDWDVECAVEPEFTFTPRGNLVITGKGTNGGALLRTVGYTFTDFHLELDFRVNDPGPPAGSENHEESNVDVRIREGSTGLSLTFFTEASDPARRNRVMLRRTNEWSTIGDYSKEIGIATNDRFHVAITAKASKIEYKVFKNGSSEPIIDWSVTDTTNHTGWISLGTFNLGAAEFANLSVGGADWDGAAERKLFGVF